MIIDYNVKIDIRYSILITDCVYENKNVHEKECAIEYLYSFMYLPSMLFYFITNEISIVIFVQ